MTILLYLTAFLFSFGQLGRISFFNQQINFYLYEITFIIGIIFLFLKYRFQPLIDSWKNFRSVYIFFAALLLSLIIGLTKFSLFQNFVGFLYLIRLATYFLYFFYLRHYLRSDPNNIKTKQRTLTMIALLTIASTIIQYFFYPDLRNLIYQGWDPHLYRTFGVFFDTSIAAAVFGIFFLVSDQPIIRIIYLVLTALSFSRSVYIGLTLTLFFIFFRQKKLKNLIIFLIIFAALIFIIPKPAGQGVNLERLYSITSRGEDYIIGLNLWKYQPIFGYGYDRIRYVKGADSLHSGATFSSSFLTILVSSGIVGMVAYIWMLWELRKSNKLAPILLIFLSIISLFDNVFLQPFILFIFFTLIS